MANGKRRGKRSSRPNLVARKGNRKAKKRATKKFKATRLLKDLVKTQINAKQESKYMSCMNLYNVNKDAAIGGGDLHSCLDLVPMIGATNYGQSGIPRGDLSNNRDGGEVFMTKGLTHFHFRVSANVNEPNTDDLYLVLYVFTPKKYPNHPGFTTVVKNGLAPQLLKFAHTEIPFNGYYPELFYLHNADEFTVHKKKIIPVHNDLGGSSSWFANYTYRHKPKRWLFDQPNDYPSNWNTCFAVGFANSNFSLNPDTATRVNVTAFSEYWYKDG